MDLTIQAYRVLYVKLLLTTTGHCPLHAQSARNTGSADRGEVSLSYQCKLALPQHLRSRHGWAGIPARLVAASARCGL